MICSQNSGKLSGEGSSFSSGALSISIFIWGGVYELLLLLLPTLPKLLEELLLLLLEVVLLPVASPLRMPDIA